jgi:hypothetical protein
MKVIDYAGMKEFRSYFSRIGLGLSDAETESSISRLIERRNVIVHNRAAISARYVELFGDRDGPLGAPLKLKLSEVMAEIEVLAKYVAEFDVRAAPKFALPTPVPSQATLLDAALA